MTLYFISEKFLSKKELKEAVKKQANIGEQSIDRYVDATVKVEVLKTKNDAKACLMADAPPTFPTY